MIPIENIHLGDGPFPSASTITRGATCVRCETRITATILARIVVGPLISSHAVLMPCGCVPSLMDKLSPAAITAVMLLIDR